MPETSQLQAYLDALKTALEADVEGVGAVGIRGKHDLAQVIAEAQRRASGQALGLVVTSGSNKHGDATPPKITHRVIVSLFDHPQLRKQSKREPLDVMEDLMRYLHGKKVQTLTARCHDTEVAGYFVEAEQGTDIYTIQLDVTIHHSLFT